MRLRSTIVLVAAASCVCGSLLLAQTTTRPADAGVPFRPGRLLESYGETLAGLNLSAAQMDQARNAMRQTREAFRSRFTDPDASPADRVQAVRAAIEQLEGSIGRILTEEQRKQFAERVEPLRIRLREQLRAEADRPAPATQPATQPAFEQRPGAPLAGRVERAIVGLGLTDAQRTAIFDILDPARDRIDQLVAAGKTANAPPQEIERRVRQVVEESYGKVANLLLSEQRQRFEGQYRNDRPLNLPPLPTPKPGTTITRDGTTMLNGNVPTKPDDDTMMMSATPGALPRVANGSRGRDAGPTSQRAASVKVGDPMPDFTLTRLNGSSITQRIFVNHPTVMIFGSLTSPSFRDRIPKLQALANSYGNGVTWVVIYTREMHPGTGDADVPERNRDDHIAVAEHKTAAERAAAARMAKQQLSIGFDVIPDSMDDALSSALGTFPSGAAIFDAEAKLVATERWAEPFAIRRALDRARGKADD